VKVNNQTQLNTFVKLLKYHEK